uniref:Translocon-associated protein subunit alpha n=1 Tax=Strigamia maritima TaxID=126957 RepID=T1J560_STRMM
MFGRLWKLWLLFMLVLPFTLNVINSGSRNSFVAFAQDANTVDDDDDGQVETEEPASYPGGSPDAVVAQETPDDEDDDEEKPLKPSPDADTYLLFTNPVGTLDLPAGKLVEFLVGFCNKGKSDFILESLDGSFRYPMDFSFYIQNFSTIHYTRVVKPTEQVTLSYSFIPSDTFSSRPFGLTINLLYKDLEGNMYLDAVFNSTVNIVEIDDGLDGETVFLYIFLIACVVLLLVVGQQFLSSFGINLPNGRLGNVAQKDGRARTTKRGKQEVQPKKQKKEKEVVKPKKKMK